VENVSLRNVYKLSSPDAILPPADTVARRRSAMCDVVQAKVNKDLLSCPYVLDYEHDASTDSGHRNSFLGVYVSYISENFEYREVFSRSMHCEGLRIGARLGKGLFQLLKLLDIAKRNGPEMVDNARINVTAAERLNARLQGILYVEMPASNLMRFVCHVGNSAAKAYLASECKFDVEIPRPERSANLSYLRSFAHHA
jgi:hypothetical protein